MIELDATNETLIRVKTCSAPISSSLTNSSNNIFNVQTTRLLTYDCMTILDHITSFLSIHYRHSASQAQGLGQIDQFGIPLMNWWAAVVLHWFCNKAAVWANHHCLVHTSAGVACEDFSAAPKKVFDSSNAVCSSN